ncbi:MAG: shikimate kinase [Cellvibrionaceae bacterium]
MKRVLIFGNSGSGKSTLAAELCKTHNLAHLDLDTLAWLPSSPPQRAPLEASDEKIQAFIRESDGWVIEGCYTDLLELVQAYATEVIFMNLPLALCVENAKNRPWEPHKYESKAAQDQNLDMLIDWISQYETREDVFSHAAHAIFYEQFSGKKSQYTANRISQISTSL